MHDPVLDGKDIAKFGGGGEPTHTRAENDDGLAHGFSLPLGRAGGEYNRAVPCCSKELWNTIFQRVLEKQA